MDLQTLETQMSEMAGLCDQLAEALEQEYGAMMAMKAPVVIALGEQKSRLVAELELCDQAVRGTLEHVSRQAGLTTRQILAHPAAGTVVTLRKRIDSASALVRANGERNQRVAEHVLGFFRREREDRGYGPSRARPFNGRYTGELLHQVI